MKDFLIKKDAGGKEIVMEVGLAIVGIVLLVLFKDTITTVVTAITTSLKAKVEAIS